MKNNELRRKNRKIQKLESFINKTPAEKTKTSDLEQYLTLTDKLFGYNPNLAVFIKTQATESLKPNAKGRRYCAKMIQLALEMFYSGPKCYRLLQKKFILPCMRTLQTKIECLDFPPGLHDVIIEFFKVHMHSFSALDKICILCIDEAALKCNLNYDAKKDEVIGLED